MPTRPYPILTVNEKAARSLRAGHPWVYGAETTGPDQPYQNGDIVDVVSAQNSETTYYGVVVASSKAASSSSTR